MRLTGGGMVPSYCCTYAVSRPMCQVIIPVTARPAATADSPVIRAVQLEQVLLLKWYRSTQAIALYARCLPTPVQRVKLTCIQLAPIGREQACDGWRFRIRRPALESDNRYCPAARRTIVTPATCPSSSSLSRNCPSELRNSFSRNASAISYAT